MNATSARFRFFRTSRSFGVLISFAVALFSASCYSPASNMISGEARLELRLPEPTTLSGRAVAGAGGYVYVRAIGGPSGDTGQLWGPISASGKSIVISDIAPGGYSNFLVLHSEVSVDDSYVYLDPIDGYEGGESSFSVLIRLRDKFLLAYVGQTAGGSDVLNQLFHGTGSYALTGPLTVKPGVNSLAVTLVPGCSGDESMTLVQEGGQFDGGIGGEAGRFVRMSFPTDAPSWQYVFFTAVVTAGDPPLSFYSSSGKRVYAAYASAEYAYSATVPRSAFPLYVYKPGAFVYSPSFTALEGNQPPEIRVMGFAGPIDTGGMLSFGYVNAGTQSRSEFVTVFNDGTLPLVVSSVAIGGANPANFSVVPSMPFTVPPQGSKEMTVTFAFLDDAPSMRYGRLILGSNDSDEGTYVINLSGDSS